MAAAVQQQQQQMQQPQTPQKRSESFSLLSTPSSSSSASRPSPLRSSSPPSTPSSHPLPSSKAMTPQQSFTSSSSSSSSSSSAISRSQSTGAFNQKVPITVEGALQQAEGDPLAALDQVVAQRNKLLEENDGLWKMVQNLRDKADTHRADASRYRSERDRALSSTRSSRGGSPGPNSAMSGSASAIGLGLAEASSSVGGSRPPRSISGGTSTLLAYPGVGKRQNSEGDGSRSVLGGSTGKKEKERFGEGGGSSSSSSPRAPPDEFRSDDRKQQLEESSRQPISTETKPTTPISTSFKNDTFTSPPPSPHPMPNSQRAPSTTPLPSSSTFSLGPTAPLRLNQRPPPPPSPTTAAPTSISAPSSPPNASGPTFASVNSFTFSSSAVPARVGPPPSSFAAASLLGEPKQSRRQQVAESTLQFPPEISQYLASLGDSPKTMPSSLPEEPDVPSLAPSPIITDTPSKPPTSPAYVLSVSSPGSSPSATVPPLVPRRRSSVPTDPPSTPGPQVPGLSTTPSPSTSTSSTLPQLTPMSPFFQNNSPNVTPGGGSRNRSKSEKEEGGAIVDVADREDEDDDPEPRAPSKDGRELQKQQQAALRAAGLVLPTGARMQEVYPNEQQRGGEEEDARTPNPSRMPPPSQPISTTPLYSPSGHSSMREAQARGPLQYREEDPRQRQQQQQQTFQGQQQQQQQQPHYQLSQHQHQQQQQQQVYAQQHYQQQQANPPTRPYQPPPPNQQQQQPGYPIYQPSQPPRSPVYAAFGPGAAPPPSTPRGPSTDHLPTSPPPPQTPRAPPSLQQQQSNPISAPSPYHQPQSQQQPSQSRGPLLQSAALPYTSLSIHSCAVVTNDSNREVIRFRIAVTITPPPSPSTAGRQQPTPSSHWKVDKLFSDFLALDGSVRGKIGRKEAKARGIVSLPEAKAWKDVAMGKLDMRKKLLETYLHSILEATLPEKDDFCWFLSTGVVPNEIAAQQIITKEGMLLKRGQKFGGWKKRFFTLGGLGRPVMDYFDAKGGTHIGSIPLAGAQIGRSKEAADGGDPHQRHAFLIIEALANGGKGTRHVLCAETDEERDEWVDILVLYTTGKYTRASSPANSTNNRGGGATSPTPPLLPRSSTSSSIQSVVASYNSNSASGRKPSVRKLSKDDIVIGSAQPLSKLSHEESSPKFASAAISSSPIDSTSPSPFGVLDSPRNEHLRRQQQQHNPKSNSTSILNDIASSGSLPNLDQASRGGGGPRNGTSSNSNHSDPAGQYADVDESSSSSSSSTPPSSSGAGRLSAQQHRQSAMPPSRLGPSGNNNTSSNKGSSNLSLSSIPPFSQQQQKQGGGGGSNSEERNGAISPDKVVVVPERIQASKISGPQGGAPIPAGFKFGAKDEVMPERDRKAKSGRWGFGFGKMAGSASANPLPQSRPVFGVPLSESLAVAKIAELPAVVYRCIEYLEAKHAELEEGIYRLSGSSAVIKGLRDRFNNEGDINLLKEGDTWDPHAICGVLKGFLRELTTSLLTRELHMRFLAVIDLVDSDERVKELRHLVGELPLPNYSLLRALTAHLILIVENAATNKMTLRNVGIVFSPTLGIPAGVFSELVLHFQNVFDDVSVGDEDQPTSEVDDANEFDRKQSKRHSVSFLGTETLLGLGGRKLSIDPEANVDEEGSIDDSATDDDASQGDLEHHPSARDRDNDPTIRMTPPSTGLTIPVEFMGGGTEVTYTRPAGSAGLPLSPRPGSHRSNSPVPSPTS